MAKLTIKFGLLVAAFLSVASALSAQTAKTSIEVPFEFVHNQIVVEVRIAGKGPFNFLVDTNTDPSAIDSATARELGLQLGAQGAPASGGGSERTTVYPTRLPQVELGGITVKEIAAAAVDLTKFSQKIERPIHGILGYSFLKDRIIQIDYPNSKLRFFAQSPYPHIQLGPNTVNLIAAPFRYEDGEVIIDSLFVNNEKMRAALDTGSSGSFALTPEAVAILKLEDQGHEVESDSVGYNGAYKTKAGVLKSVRLGRYSVDSVPATFWLPNTGHDGKKFQVNIGNGFFQSFIMTFDFKGKMVVFERVD